MNLHLLRGRAPAALAVLLGITVGCGGGVAPDLITGNPDSTGPDSGSSSVPDSGAAPGTTPAEGGAPTSPPAAVDAGAPISRPDGGLTLACTSAASCSNGKVCCLTGGGPGTTPTAACATTCSGGTGPGGGQLCAGDAECREGRCRPIQGGISICAR